MAKFQDIYGDMVMLGLMVLALLSLIIIIQSDNSASQPLEDEVLISSTYGNLSSTIKGLEEKSNKSYVGFSGEKLQTGGGIVAIVLFTIVDVGRTFGNIMFGMFTLIIKIPLIVLQIDQSITAMIISFFTISVIISLWIVYKFGG